MAKTKRLSFDVPAELHDRLSGVLSYGNRSYVLRIMVEHLVKALEIGGSTVLGGIISRELNPFEVLGRKKNEVPGSDETDF